MNTADIRKGEYLEKAKETTVEDFFEKRMLNKIKKVLGANWEILFESSDFIYFGYPLISFFREGTYLEEFFKVNKNQLNLDFPSYKEFDGILMRRLCYEIMSEHKKSNQSLYPAVECKGRLEKESILIYVNLRYKLDENQYKIEKYSIEIDKKNLQKRNITKTE